MWGYLRDPDNGYFHKKIIKGYEFSLIQRPTDLLVEQELSKTFSKEDLLKIRDKYKKYLYLNLSISRNNQELLSTTPRNRSEFGAMVSQLAFGMGEKVHLFTQQKDTITLADYIYPRMYGMSNSTDMMFVYPKDEIDLMEGYINFSIEDFGLFTGEVKFKIPLKNIKEEPRLKFKVK